MERKLHIRRDLAFSGVRNVISDMDSETTILIAEMTNSELKTL